MALEQVGLQIVVDDRGTPVVRRHVAETTRGLQQIEAASGRSGAALERSMEGAGISTAKFGGTLSKSTKVLGALAGGFDAAGTKAVGVSRALSTLILVGFNPLALAIAGVAAGLGALVSRHSEAAEAAKAHAQAERDFAREMVVAEAEMRKARGGGGGGGELAGQAFDMADAQRRADAVRARLRGSFLDAPMDRFRTRMSRNLLGGLLGIEDPAEKARKELGEIEAEIERFRARIAQGTRAQDDTAIIRERDLAKKEREEMEAWDRAHLDRLRAEAFERGRFRGTPDSDPDGREEADRLRAIAEEQERARASRADYVLGIERETQQIRRLAGATDEYERQLLDLRAEEMRAMDREGLSRDDRRRIALSFADRRRGVMDARDAAAADAAGAPERMRMEFWRHSGRDAGTAWAGAFSENVSTALLTGEGSVRDLAKDLSEIMVRAIVDALVAASIQKPLQDAFAQVFAQIGSGLGALGFRGPGPSGGDGGGPVFAPAGGGMESGIKVSVAPAPVRIASERVFASAPDEAVRARVMVATSGPGVRGSRS